MARPRKYHTDEERRLAKCRKSKKWYDKPLRMTTRAPSTIEHWLYRLGRLKAKVYDTFQQRTASRHIKQLYIASIIERSTLELDAALAAVEKLRSQARRYADEILSLSGVGSDYAQVETLQRSLSEVAKALEEIIMFIMQDDIKELEARYTSNQLLFQKLD
ncbi:hypothetical protein H0H92_001390 [Tricholoma furcatifolium]|nr:hypothetical protein H0H92_001390 [Tricholoma furcatifolium]